MTFSALCGLVGLILFAPQLPRRWAISLGWIASLIGVAALLVGA